MVKLTVMRHRVKPAFCMGSPCHKKTLTQSIHTSFKTYGGLRRHCRQVSAHALLVSNAPRGSSYTKVLRAYSTASHSADPALTEEDVEQYSQGTHPALTKPIKTYPRNSLIVDDYQAPNTGVIKVLTLTELRTFNALSKQMVGELSEEIESIHAEQGADATRVLIIRSEAEKAFCAGANLKERAGMTVDECVVTSI